VPQAWILTKYPETDLEDALILQERELPKLADGEVKVRVHYVSVDPGMRTWIRKGGSYMPALPLGSPMPGSILGDIVESRSERFSIGDRVVGMGEWSDMCTIPGSRLRSVSLGENIDPLASMSVLGATGWTAYVGMIDIGRPTSGETVVVSAAAGAVGSIASQLARIRGCRVIGITGANEKCAWLTSELGLDAAINYRSEDVCSRLDALCPNGIDVYFENVGGEIGRAVYPRMARHGRIALCGLVASYDESVATAEIDLDSFLMKRVRLEGFNVTDHFHRIGEINSALLAWLAEGQLRHHVELVDGLENCANALGSILLSGDRHRGKLLVRIAPD
jgi:Putative NADP-dependent oxidoreductases